MGNGWEGGGWVSGSVTSPDEMKTRQERWASLDEMGSLRLAEKEIARADRK